MNDLVKSMKVSLATVFSFYLKAHFFHWNVEGADFYEYHKLFQKIYEDVFDSVDGIAEQIRALDSFAPGSYVRFKELSTVEDETKVPTSAVMVDTLLIDNDKVVAALNKSIELATKHNQQGLVNFLGGRLEQHAKWGWFLRATKKNK